MQTFLSAFDVIFQMFNSVEPNAFKNLIKFILEIFKIRQYPSEKH